MNTFFECKVRYTKIDSKTGKEGRVTEPYIVNAISFTDAEEKIFKHMEAYISGEFTVTNIRRVNYTDIVPNEAGDKYYKCKITFLSIDEATGKMKKVSQYILIQADTVEKATEALKDVLKSFIVDTEIISVGGTPIIDCFLD